MFSLKPILNILSTFRIGYSALRVCPYCLILRIKFFRVPDIIIYNCISIRVQIAYRIVFNCVDLQMHIDVACSPFNPPFALLYTQKLNFSIRKRILFSKIIIQRFQNRKNTPKIITIDSMSTKIELLKKYRFAIVSKKILQKHVYYYRLKL